MNKVVSFLETYVEWIAIGLAALWLIWVGYGYWLSSPVMVEFNTQQYRPDQIDKEVAKEAERVQQQLNDPNPKLPNAGENSVLRDFSNNIAINNVPPLLIDLGPLAPMGTAVAQGPEDQNNHMPDATIPDTSQMLTTDTPPATTGMSLVLLEKDKAPVEKIWATVSFNFDHSAFADAWNDAKLPPRAQRTCFLHADLVRQELINGQWVDEKTIPPLSIHPMDKDAIWPPSDAPTNKKYDAWATTHIEDIIEPKFFDVIYWLGSDKWYTVTMTPPPPLFIPEKKTVIVPTTPIVKPKPQPPRTPAFTPPVGRSPTITRQPPRTKVVTTTPPPPPPAPDTQPALPADLGKVVTPPAVGMLPAGLFSPASVPDDLEIWAHDDTVVPGHTYRYKLILYMHNPLYDTVGIAKDQKDATVYWMKLQSDWTDGVTIPPRTYFYFTNDHEGLSRIEAEVYTWTMGNWIATHKVPLEPGDTIPGTDCTLVDVQKDPAEARIFQIIVRDSDGMLNFRTVKQDKIDERHKRLEGLAEAAKPPPGVSVAP